MLKTGNCQLTGTTSPPDTGLVIKEIRNILEGMNQKSELHTAGRTLIVCSLTILLYLISNMLAAAPVQQLRQGWFNPPADLNLNAQLDIHSIQTGDEAATIKLTGGVFWYLTQVAINESGSYVIDFNNSSVIGRFSHFIFDEQGKNIAQYSGGIQSKSKNPFMLRHGRTTELDSGRYTIITKLDSPFFLAKPVPSVTPIEQYQSSIKFGNLITLIGLGIFIALGFYYAVLSLFRFRPADIFYSTFILGNLIFNSTALLVLSDVFDVHWFYSISIPILISNIAYISFVLYLLDINYRQHPRLFVAGILCMATLTGHILISILLPNQSLELDRYGVAIFSVFGFTCGIIRMFQGNMTARLYMIANVTFLIPAVISISLNSLSSNFNLLIEHIGLIAVATEVLMLALVLNYQVGQVYQEKEEALETTRKALSSAEKANTIKNEFLANVSHEIRTPITGIMGALELLKLKIANKDGLELVRIIDSSSNFLLSLINDILDLSKINAGQLELHKMPFDLDRLLSEMIELFALTATQKNICISLDQDPTLPSSAFGDEMRIRQILTNLLGNSLKFTSEGEVRLEVKKGENNHILFKIKDTGIGIAANKVKDIFNPFTQTDSSISRRFGGTGLGLSIAQKLALMMDGTLSVSSEEGQGSEFTLSIPLPEHPVSAMNFAYLKVVVLSDQDDSEAHKIIQDLPFFGINVEHHFHDPECISQLDFTPDILFVFPAQSSIPEGKELLEKFKHQANRVYYWIDIARYHDPDFTDTQLVSLPYTRFKLYSLLIAELSPSRTEAKQVTDFSKANVIAIDDNHVNLQILVSMLHRIGVNATGFMSPERAIEAAINSPPDCIIMDMQMPTLDGPSATRVLRQKQISVPIIAYTANATDTDRKICVESGMNDFLIKPVKLEVLRSTLSRWLNN